MSCTTPFDIGVIFDPTAAPHGHGITWKTRNHYVGDVFAKVCIVLDAFVHELDGEKFTGTSRSCTPMPSVLIESNFSSLAELKPIFDTFAPDGDRSYYTEDGRPAEFLSTMEKTIYSYDPVKIQFYYSLNTRTSDIVDHICFACELFPQLFHHGFIAAFMSVLHNHYLVFHSHHFCLKSLSNIGQQCNSRVWAILFRSVFDRLALFPWFRTCCTLFDTISHTTFTQAFIARTAATEEALRGHLLVAGLVDCDEFRGPPRCTLMPAMPEEIGMSDGDGDFGVLVHAWMCTDRRETFYEYLRSFRF